MKFSLRILATGLALFIIGCVSAPKETVHLSEIVDKQITEMQASHEKFVRLYYGKLRDEVESFMEQKWIPQFLSNVVAGTGEQSRMFRAELDKAYKLSGIDWEDIVRVDHIRDEDVRAAVEETVMTLSMKQNAALGMVLIDFSQAAQTEINKQRRALIQPIDEQESLVLNQLGQGYADLLRGSAAIRGYLAATVELVEERDAILQKAGLLEAQQQLLDTAVKLSDGAVKALWAAKKADEGIEKFLGEMDKTKEKLESIPEGGG